MEIYFKNRKGQLEETKLSQLLIHALNKGHFEMDNGSFDGEDNHWIGIVQETDKPSQVVTNITFKDDGYTITGVNVYEAPIKRVVDQDNSRRVI